MRLARAIVVLRHNTKLPGDIHLAVREFQALVGSGGALLQGRRELTEAVGGLRAASVPMLSTVAGILWSDVTMEGIGRLLRQSAFAQEVIVTDPDNARLEAFARVCPTPSARIAELLGQGVVALALNYVIESEGVLDDPRLAGRVGRTVELLLEPYVTSSPSMASERLRGAKKTTLSLSHDLHIYKAKFFPRMVRALLNLFRGTSGVAFDPFCGSGTALLEASLLGMDGVGIDVDPICQLISRTKVGPFFEAAALTHALDAFEHALIATSPRTEGFDFPKELADKIARQDRRFDTNYLSEIRTEAAVLAGALRSTGTVGLAGDLLTVLASDAVTKKVRYRFVGVGNGKYTIEIVKQRLLDRLAEKIGRCRQLACVFPELRDELGIKFGTVQATAGDARDRSTWPSLERGGLIVTSPPYLPASSGREHYAASRALAFAVLGYQPGAQGYFDTPSASAVDDFNVRSFPEAANLMTYLESDASEFADPQRDAMRFQRKAEPTRHYLGDMLSFLEGANAHLGIDEVLLLVIAHHHTFYSHRRQEIEHIVRDGRLYSELAAAAGLGLNEEIELELLKPSNSRARPRAKDDYYESVLVVQRAGAPSGVEQLV